MATDVDKELKSMRFTGLITCKMVEKSREDSIMSPAKEQNIKIFILVTELDSG